MPRVRIRFSKRGYACFISHIDLPILFSRAARRAGLMPEQTQGFSPHPRTALGPPLPVGVVGLAEPADFWFGEWACDSAEKWNAALPEGLDIIDVREIDSDGPSLNKLCKAAGYEMRPLSGVSAGDIAAALGASMAEFGPVLDIGEGHIYVGDIEKMSASRMVKILVESGLVSGWSDLAITRTGVGIWDGDAGRINGA